MIKHDGTYNSGGFLRAGVKPTDNPMLAPGTLHPAVIRIPETRDAVLYLGRRRMSYIAGLTLAASDPFPPGERRLMHRTQIKGTAAPAAHAT